MPRCTNAECNRTTRRERQVSRLPYRHCRAAQGIYQAVLPSLQAGDYDAARRTAAQRRLKCLRCGVTPQFLLTFPAWDADPSGYSLLEVKQMFTFPHQAPAGYPKCRDDTIHIPQLIELDPKPYICPSKDVASFTMAVFVGDPALDPAYGQQDPSGIILPTLSCNASVHARCAHAQTLRELIAETASPDQAAALLTGQPPLRLPDGHVADFRLAMLTTAGGASSYQIVETSPNRQNYIHARCDEKLLRKNTDWFAPPEGDTEKTSPGGDFGRLMLLR